MGEEKQQGGRVVTPEDPDYEQSCQEWNSRIEVHPREIVYCQDAKDVQAALLSALKQNIPFRARCGGHSYEVFSMVDDGVVIDVSNMNSVTVNREKTEAVIGGGGKLGDVYSKLWDPYKVTIPAGTCPPVGISGLTLGGGLGMLVRSRGLLIDSLTGVEMVDAKGNIINADSTHNADLFWACRGGGGGNFGIVTSLTFRVQPIDQVTVFNIEWAWSDFAAAFDAWQRWAPDSDERISGVFVLLAKSANSIIYFGEFQGTEAEFQPLIDPLLTKVKPSKDPTIKSMSYIDAVTQISTWEGDASTTASNRVVGNTSYVSDLFGKEAIGTLEEWLAKAPPAVAPTVYPLLGAISRVAPEETAYPHRKMRLLITYQANWTEADEDQQYLDWIAGVREAMLPYSTSRCYVNISDRVLKDWPHAYYDQNLDRLVEIKRKYDPDNVFNFEQSIPLSLTK